MNGEKMSLWTTDADNLNMDSPTLQIVLRNRPVAAFLSDSNSLLGVAGIKGQGKTFLLKAKRKSSFENGVVCIPQDKMADSIDGSVVRYIDAGALSLLANYDVWIDVWKVSIGLSVLSTLKQSIDMSISNLCPSAKGILSSGNGRLMPPSEIMSILLHMQEVQLKQVLRDTHLITLKMRSVDQPVHIFIDKVDQTFSALRDYVAGESSLPSRVRNQEIWFMAQVSLAQAAYEIRTNINSHIKVFYAIRLEALKDMDSWTPLARNISSFITRLQYSKNELREMYALYIAAEKPENLIDKDLAGSSPSRAFVGVGHVSIAIVVENQGGLNCVETHEEDVFDYIYRHTMKRPQDLMTICRALYDSLDRLDNETIREIVNSTSDEIMSQYVRELSVFTSVGKDEIKTLVRMIPGDLLSSDVLREICRRFSKMEATMGGCNLTCSRCDSSAPFGSLYNIGLLGEVRVDESGNVIQYFKQADSSTLNELGEFSIRSGTEYVLHPCLYNAARKRREWLHLVMHKAPKLVAGDGQPFDREYDRSSYYRAIDNEVMRDRVFVSSTIEDLQEERFAIHEYLSSYGFNPIMSEGASFPHPGADGTHAHDYCIDQALQCGSVVFMLGSTTGWPYHGVKYSKFAQEITERVEQDTQIKGFKPSISLVEFYTMIRSGKKCYAFVSTDTYKHIKKRNVAPLYRDLKTEYQFINHLKVIDDSVRGNWMSQFDNVKDLINRLSCIVF